MKKILLAMVLGILLIISVAFNIIQYKNIKILKEKVSLFENNFMTYDNLLSSIQEQDKRNHIITVYIKPEISESQILSLKDKLINKNSINSIKYISADQALADFKAKHPDSIKALEELNINNPLGASFTITFSDLSQKQTVLNFIKANDFNSIIDKID